MPARKTARTSAARPAANDSPHRVQRVHAAKAPEPRAQAAEAAAQEALRQGAEVERHREAERAKAVEAEQASIQRAAAKAAEDRATQEAEAVRRAQEKAAAEEAAAETAAERRAQAVREAAEQAAREAAEVLAQAEAVALADARAVAQAAEREAEEAAAAIVAPASLAAAAHIAAGVGKVSTEWMQWATTRTRNQAGAVGDLLSCRSPQAMIAVNTRLALANMSLFVETTARVRQIAAEAARKMVGA